MSYSNTGSVDLESVLSVRRRILAAVGENKRPAHRHHYTDTIYLKREDSSNSILSINSNVIIFGELQFLCAIFERYTSNIIFYEESTEANSSSPPSSHVPSFSTTLEEDEPDIGGPPTVSTVRRTSTASSKISSSPPQAPESPLRRRGLNLFSRPQAASATTGEFSTQNLEGKRYGCIELPNMVLIEILEILLRTGLELVHESSDYDKENVLHQNFVFSKSRSAQQKYGQLLSRSISYTGT